MFTKISQNIFKNPQKRDKKRNKEAATEAGVMKELQKGKNFPILNLNNRRLGRLKVRVINQIKVLY